MGKSMSGPSMEDCLTYMEEIQKHNDCVTTILLETVGLLGGCYLRVHILSVEKGKVDPQEMWSVSTAYTYPHREYRTWEGSLFKNLAWHDAELASKHFTRNLGLT